MRNCALLHRSGNVKMFQCDLSDRDNAITLLLNCADNLQIKILNFKLSLSSNLRVWFSFGPCNAWRRHSARHRHRNYGIRHRFWFLKSPISTFPRLRNLAGILIRQKISIFFLNIWLGNLASIFENKKSDWTSKIDSENVFCQTTWSTQTWAQARLTRQLNESALARRLCWATWLYLYLAWRCCFINLF